MISFKRGTPPVPAHNVYLDKEYSRTEEDAHQILRKLTHTRLRDITASVEIFYDPKLDSTDIEEDQDFVDAFFAIPDEDIRLEMHSPWLLRLELDRAKDSDNELRRVVFGVDDKDVLSDSVCNSIDDLRHLVSTLQHFCSVQLQTEQPGRVHLQTNILVRNSEEGVHESSTPKTTRRSSLSESESSRKRKMKS
jgi:hypothetical protein